MGCSNLSFGESTRVVSVAIAIISGIMCIKGIMMVAAAVSLASVIGGIFFMVVGGGICLTALGTFTLSAAASSVASSVASSAYQHPIQYTHFHAYQRPSPFARFRAYIRPNQNPYVRF